MGSGVLRPTTIALNGLILTFSACLIYFVFVYYPSVAQSVRLELPLKRLFADKAVVEADRFPIVTKEFRISYESDSSLYYVFVAGETLDGYVENKSAAQLSLKNTLQTDSLCELKVIYSSGSSLELSGQYKSTSGCN